MLAGLLCWRAMDAQSVRLAWRTDVTAERPNIHRRQSPGALTGSKGRGSSDMAFVEVLNGPASGTRCIVRSCGRTALGRDSSNDLAIPDRRVSRKHFEIELVCGTPTIRDLGSKNGTFVNGSRVNEVVLKDDDIIGLGESGLWFRTVECRECHCCQTFLLDGEEVWTEGRPLCPACSREYALLEGKVEDPVGEIARKKKASRRMAFDGSSDTGCYPKEQNA